MPDDIPEPADAPVEALPEQEARFRAPARFGNVPVATEPLGWDDRNRGFRNHYPVINLPTQIVDRVSFDAPDLEPNRLIWGDNLHILRQMPSESVDLVYADPPFFSNRVYNVIWGDDNEERSFSDIWEGGLDGYLIWLNARLYELKRLLKPTGSIYVHCDWHASHYIKVELDKIFGYENFRNEIMWHYGLGGFNVKSWFPRKHDVLLYYAKSKESHHNKIRGEVSKWMTAKYSQEDEKGKYFVQDGVKYYLKGGKPVDTFWDNDQIIDHTMSQTDTERVGYPTQKPEAVLRRVIEASSNEGDIVLDPCVGGGTTPAVAERLGRRWIAIDQSRVAVAVTAERLKAAAAERGLEDAPIPDFTVEHWGVYEAEKLSEMPETEFRDFVLACYDARIASDDAGIHGYKGARARVPVWVGPPGLTARVTATEVNGFAQAIAGLDRYHGEEGLRDGVMLAWGFAPDAVSAARELRERADLEIAFVRLEQVRIDSPAFRSHIASQSTDRGDYSEFLTFVQPPEVEFAWRRLKPLHYEFDAGDTDVLNAGAKIVNVQWDFGYDGRQFRAVKGEWFRRGKGRDPAPILDSRHTFPREGRFTVACRVQDDKGGEGMRVVDVDVT